MPCPSPPPKTTANAPSFVDATRGWPILVLLIAVGPLLYEVGKRIALAAGDLPAVRLGSLVAASIGAVLLLFAVPWLLAAVALRRIESIRPAAGAWSLAVNSLALILLCLVLRSTVGIGQNGLLVGWLAWTTALLILAGEPARCVAELGDLWRRWGIGLAIGLAAVAIGIVLFHQEHLLQCFNGDGTESKELAQSLLSHGLPYWEIETAERFGTYIVNPKVINSYWTLALQLLLGANEAATRLPFWIWWFAVFAVSLRIVQGRATRAAWLPAVPLGLALLLTSLWYTFYTTYYPYMADPANPAVPDGLFTLLLLLAWDCLRREDCAGWAVSMILASLVFYAGPVMFVLMVAAVLLWQPVPRRRFLPAAAITALVLLAIGGIYVLVGWQEGSLSPWSDTLHREVFRKYANPDRFVAAFGSPWLFTLVFAGYFLLGCGGIPALGLARGFFSSSPDDPKDAAWDRSIAAVTVAYLAIVLGSGHKNLHYLGPLLPVPLILWLKCRRVAASAGATPRAAPASPARWAASLLAAAGLGAAMFLSWPVSRQPLFTLNQKLGAITTFQTDEYSQACRWARIARKLHELEYLGWEVSEHTWASYSELDSQPAEPRPLLVTSRAAAPEGHGYELLFRSSMGPLKGISLYSRDPEAMRWMKAQRPPIGPDRYPRIFRPIAVSPLEQGVSPEWHCLLWRKGLR